MTPQRRVDPAELDGLLEALRGAPTAMIAGRLAAQIVELRARPKGGREAVSLEADRFPLLTLEVFRAFVRSLRELGLQDVSVVFEAAHAPLAGLAGALYQRALSWGHVPNAKV